jgi:hypothetical protein
MFHARRRLALLTALCAVMIGATASSALAAGFARDSSVPGNSAVGELDPLNPDNQVFAFKTDATHAGAIYRPFGAPGIKVGQLLDQLQVKYYLQDKSCLSGSPRFQLGIDQDGNGTIDHNAFGYFGTTAFGGGCSTNAWTFQDGTDNVPRWDLSQFGGPMTDTFAQMVSFFDSTYPNHRVRKVSIVEDNTTGGALPGCSFYDQIDVFGNSATQWADVSEPTNTSLCPDASSGGI